jgi:hypothetical protein
MTPSLSDYLSMMHGMCQKKHSISQYARMATLSTAVLSTDDFRCAFKYLTENWVRRSARYFRLCAPGATLQKGTGCVVARRNLLPCEFNIFQRVPEKKREGHSTGVCPGLLRINVMALNFLAQGIRVCRAQYGRAGLLCRLGFDNPTIDYSSRHALQSPLGFRMIIAFIIVLRKVERNHIKSPEGIINSNAKNILHRKHNKETFK